jgi:hypothetical protein
MKKNILLKPLINSGIVLALLILLLYLTSSNPEATVWSSMGMIIITVLKTAQWLLAMIIGLLICLAFLFVIFFGAIAMFDKTMSVHMYQGTLKVLLSSLFPFMNQCNNTVQPVQEQQTTCCGKIDQEDNQEPTETLKEQFSSEISLIEAQIHTTKEVLTGKIEQLSSRIDELEKMTVDMASGAQLENLGHEVQGALSSLAGIQGAVDSMQNCVEQTADLIKAATPEKILGDLPERVQVLEQQENTAEPPEVIDTAPLEKDIADMQSELALVKEKADKALQSLVDGDIAEQEPLHVQEEQIAVIESEPKPESEGDTEEHRILSYFDNQDDKKKFADLVASTLHKDMTYKQVQNFLAKELGAVKGEIISSYPSLSKDYIRQCRKSS